MRLALTLTLFLSAACASNDGFVNQTRGCGPGEEVGIEAGWDVQGASMERGDDRLTMLVRVSNNSSKEITVKAVRVDPMMMDRDTMYEIERGSRDFNQIIAEGDASTFEIPMMSRRRMQDRTTGVRASGVDVAVTVLLEPDVSHRCQFRVPLGF